MTTAPQRRSLGYISDQETKIDLLRNEAIAKTIIQLIGERPDRSVTIGVHGGWGAGKSSVLEMIHAGFDTSPTGNESRVLCLKFNGWQFQGFEDAKIAVIEGVVTELIAHRTFLSKATDEVKEVLRHIDWLKVARRAGGLAFSALTGLPSPDQIADLMSFAIGKLHDPATFLTSENARLVAGELQAVWKKVPESRSVPEEVRGFHQAFGKLMGKAKLDRLVVIVDDLDRCLPETAVETLEAIRLFISLPMTAFVVGADEEMIKYAVRRHFPELPQGEPWTDYPRAYLEKLIQVPFRIPSMGETETHIYVTLLFVGSLIGEEKSEFSALLATAKSLLSKPWEGKALEEHYVRSALGALFTEQVKSAFTLSQRIAPALSRGTRGNPRQVKRFLNTLNLRLRVSDERGFGSAIDPLVLAKVMLAERFLPAAVFEYIAGAAATSSDGICPELDRLETAASVPKDSESKAHESEPNPIVDDWLTRPDVVRWANIEPKLRAINLRPYLFVINDVKNYAESDAPLAPKLRDLLEKITSGEASARAAAPQLKQLDQAEVELLVKELRLRILASASFANRPEALIGLGEIVHAHPAFGLRYVEILEELPASRLGMWAASGHDRYLAGETVKQRAEIVFRRWKTEGSPPLQAALETRSRLKPGKA
jgi:predicted KAP-like P-loop ATPase